MGKRWALTGLFILLAPFQNCGQFRSADVLAQASLAQCRTGYRSEALRRQTLESLNLTCADADAYACERRIFAPDQSTDAVDRTSECPANDTFCVDVVTRRFATAAARTADNAAQFEAGGDYNHVEVRCYHRWTYRGQIVIENEAADLADALANVRQDCLNAQGEGK